jgi:hypothetical protein
MNSWGLEPVVAMNTWRPEPAPHDQQARLSPSTGTTPTALGDNQVGAAVLCRHLVADGSVHAFLADHRSIFHGELLDLAPVGLPT